MRNATVAALIYEFLFDVYQKMDHDRRQGWSQSSPDKSNSPREVFDHDFMGGREWTSGVLESVGVLEALRPDSGYRGAFHPLITLDECAAADFSKFESFDNYCVAMFSFEYQFVDAVKINPSMLSPRFVDAIALQDDIFFIKEDGNVVFDKSRFEEKVMARWRSMDVRVIHPKEG
ncbi:hypothetical protein [Bradyrhizobium sp. BR 10289]|uniref:hypothetical protein n=1 Tax=Bradyrhizobium sp. BR 10289 TaxID=2749993 RepID=UPI001C64B189|nr:hypothetical protein [Bradyrhizobium sp. BR 10289]MBW7974926.1 hypothetical protein [Bradyrhizobium sp. BR 10289]